MKTCLRDWEVTLGKNVDNDNVCRMGEENLGLMHEGSLKGKSPCEQLKPGRIM